MAGFGVGKDYIVSIDADVDRRNPNDVDIEQMISRLNLIMFREIGGNKLPTFSESDLGCEYFTFSRFYTTHYPSHSPASLSMWCFRGPGLWVARADITWTGNVI
jgi:hypothetical protein